MDLSKTQLIESVFAGGGEMRERMRALDWSTTALGPLEQWSRSLRICVRIVLGSGYPMTIYWGPDYTMLYNDACRQVMGTKHPAALGRGFREAFPEMWDSVRPLLDRVMTQGQDISTLTDQLFPLNRNGYLEECYFATSFSPIPDDTGELGGVLNTALETTDRVIEDRRRQLLRDLASRAAEARTEGVVWRVSEKTLSEHRLSVPFALLYGYRPAEGRAYLAGTSMEVSSLDPAVIDCTNQNPWRFDAALPLEGVTVELGPRVLALPKSTWPMPVENATVVPVRLREDSDTLGFLVLGIHPGRAFDDTYRHFVRRIAEQIAIGLASARAYEQEHQRADALAEVDRAKTVFFSSVSHEFRTPLTLMLGPLEEVLPEAGERLGPERHRQLLTVRRNALRLLKLVNTLLDFSRIEAGRMQAVYEPTDLASLTSDIASVFHSAMDNAGLRFSVECSPIGEPVYVDRDMWEKVVLNLLSNAFKFTFEGEVAVTLKPVDGAVELRVRDTGVGIAEEERERVFERFHRVESTHARTYEGTGIGLALVQELVKLHGGSVKVESGPGKGSTFTVTIPTGEVHLPAERIQAARALVSTQVRADAYADEAQRWLPDKSSAAVDVAMLPKPASPAPSPEPEPAMKRQLIVVADDNADMRQYLRSLLRDRYEVHAVADGSQALEATRYLRPALVLADVMMPRLDGFALLRAIRDDSTLASTPVILLSARAGEESRVEGLQTGADDYLIKPFTARELLARVATHVKMATLRRETGEHEERLRSAAEALQSSERNLAAIINTIPTAAWTTRPDGYCDFINQVWLDYAGMSAEQTQGWGWAEAIHSDDRKRLIDEWQSCLASGSPVDTEARIRRFDGSHRWFLIRANPLRDESGNILKWCGTCMDIDDRKQGEEDLRTRELSWRGIVDSIPGLVATTGAMGEVEFLNRQTLEYFGKTSEELKNWALIGAVHPDDLPRVIEARKKSIEAGQIYEIEHRCRRADGVYRWFQVRGLPVRDTDNKVTAWYLLLTDIDDRKKAEDALHSNERNLSLIINTMPTFAWSARPDGSVEFLNQRWLDYTGLSPEQALNWGWTAAIHPDDLNRLTDYWRSIVVTGEPGETEARLRRFDGEYRWFLIRADALRDESGTIVKWYGTNSDIEGRKRAEEALRVSEERARLMVDSIDGQIMTATPKGEVEFVNQQVLDYFGKSLDELKDWRTNNAIHPDDFPRALALWMHSVETGDPYHFDERLRRADGAYRWFRVRGRCLRDAQGHVGRWYVLLTDIDEGKRAEAQVEQAYLRLAEAQRVSKTGSFITNLVADEHNWSEETFRIFEFDPATKVTVQRIRDLIHAEDLPSFDAMIARAMTGVDVDFLFRILTSRGAVKHIRGMARVIEQIAGRPLFIGALQDVTESKVAEEALNRARSELAHVARITTLNALTASIAHEINQPLASLITNASICLRRLNANPPNVDGARETAMRTIRDGNRAGDVITRLRALYSKKEFAPETLDLNEATREVIALSLTDLQRNSVILRSELADGLPLVTGDRIQLQQVILNLVRNASDAMGSVDDRPRELLIRTEQERADHVRLSVKDAGVGFTGEVVDKLFQAFYTTKNDGMGIGLHVSQSIIEAHHGRLWATPNDGPGVTFSFAIPCRPEGSEDIQTRSDLTDAG